MGPTTLRRRLLNGLGALFYGQALIIVIQLAGVPILLYAWGPRLYGEWLLLFTIPSYLSMADLGFSQSAANDMAARYARGDSSGALAVFQSLTILVYSTAALCLLIVLPSCWLLPIRHWLHINGLSARDINWILTLLAVEVVVKLADGVSHAGFRSHGEYGFHVALSYTTLLLQFSALWIVALAGGGLISAAAAFALIRVAATPAVTAWLFHRHSNLLFGVSQANRVTLFALARPALANITMPLALALNIQGMVLLVGATQGPLEVVTFVTLRTLTRLISQTAWKVSHAFEPELATAWGMHDVKFTRSLYEHSLRAAFWVAVPACIGLLLFGPWILRIWTHGHVKMNFPLYFWLILSAMLSAIWYAALNLLKSANVHLRAAVWYVLCAIGGLVLAAALLQKTSILSNVGLALVVADLIMFIYLWRAVTAMLEMPLLELTRAMIDFRPLIRLIAERRVFHATR